MMRIVELLKRPTGQQAQAIADYLKQQPAIDEKEEWNTAFGPTSLFDAWTSSQIAQQIYTANALAIARFARDKTTLRIADVGVGDGSMWAAALPKLTSLKTLHMTLIDPSEEALTQTKTNIQQHAPDGCLVSFDLQQAPVQDVSLPPSDLIMCSLTLHHLAGADQAERAQVGMSGPGKTEVLAQFANAIGPNGLLLINEADVYCDIGLPSGHPVLKDNLIDSYIRRCTRALLAEDTTGFSEDLKQRRRVMIRRWFLGQPALADVPIDERDVYELTVERWLTLFHNAGLVTIDHRFTDEQRLFHQYQLRAATHKSAS